MSAHDHTISVPLPETTRLYGIPNACANCHADDSTEWAEKWSQTWWGARPTYQAYRNRILERAQVLSEVLNRRRVDPARLIAWLDDPKGSVVQRASAADFLGVYDREPGVVDALARHARDPHPLVRFYVVGALARLSDPAARPPLRAALEDERLIVRLRAYEALALLEPGIVQGLDALEEANRVRQEVIRADDPRTLSDTALWHFTRGDRAEAERLLRRGVAIFGAVPGMRIDYVQFLLQSRRFTDADAEIRQLEAPEPDGFPALFTRGLWLLAQSRHAEALERFETLRARGLSNPVLDAAHAAAVRALGGGHPAQLP